MRDLIVYGAGPFARLMAFYFGESGRRVAAFAVDAPFRQGNSFEGLPLLDFERAVESHPPAHFDLFVAVGYKRMRARHVVCARARDSGYLLASYLSPGALVSPAARLGEGNVLLAGVVVEPFVAVGDNNVFWSGTVLCHDVRVGSHGYFGARCVIGGGSRVEDGVFFGNASLTINDIRVGREAHALPGAVLMQDAAAFTKYLGNPARAVGSHEQDGIVIERG